MGQFFLDGQTVTLFIDPGISLTWLTFLLGQRQSADWTLSVKLCVINYYGFSLSFQVVTVDLTAILR